MKYLIFPIWVLLAVSAHAVAPFECHRSIFNENTRLVEGQHLIIGKLSLKRIAIYLGSEIKQQKKFGNIAYLQYIGSDESEVMFQGKDSKGNPLLMDFPIRLFKNINKPYQFFMAHLEQKGTAPADLPLDSTAFSCFTGEK